MRKKKDTAKKSYRLSEHCADIIKDVALHYGRDMGPTELAKKHGISRQRVQQIACKLRENGINVPVFSSYTFVINELKKEHPELVKNTKYKHKQGS